MAVTALALQALGIAVAIWAQARLTGGAHTIDSAAWFGVAAILFFTGLELGTPHAVAFSGTSPATTPPGEGAVSSATESRRIDLGQLFFALVFSAIAFATSGDTKHPPLDGLTVLALCNSSRLPAGGEFTLVNTVAWLAAVGFGMEALWQGSILRSLRRTFQALPTFLTNRQTLAVLGIVLAGGFFLFARLDAVPREMTSDHAEKLLDAQFILDGHRPIFLPCNTGREAMQFYLIALMVPLTGMSYLTMKLGTALLGLLALPFCFLLARRLVGAAPALLAFGIMAVTRWHWQVSRVGLRFPFPPLFGGAIFFTLLRALQTRRRNDFLLCGLVLGIAQHTYTALRLAPVAVVLCVGIAMLHDAWLRRFGAARRLLVDTLLLGFVSLLVSLPLVRYAYDQPITFLYRGVSRVASDALDAPPTNPLAVFAGNVKNAFLMFNWRGDLVWVNTIPEAPMLDLVSAALFALGAVCLLYTLVRCRSLAPLYVIALIFAGLFPSIMSLAYPEENPSTVRTGMAIPVVALVIALPALAFVRQLRATLPASIALPAGGIALAGLFAAIVPINANEYFTIYARQHTASSQHASVAAAAISDFVESGGSRQDAYLLPWSYWLDWRLVAIEAGDIKWHVLVDGLEPVRLQDGIRRPRLVLVHPDDDTSLRTLRDWYPAATRREWLTQGTTGEPWVIAIHIPAGAIAGVPSASIAGPDQW